MSTLLSEIKVFDLPVATAEKILKEYIEKDTQKEVASITFIMETRSVGYGMSERAEKYLSGINVIFK